MFGATCACSNCAGLFLVPVPERADAGQGSMQAPHETDGGGAGLSAEAQVRFLEREREAGETIRSLEEALEQSGVQRGELLAAVNRLEAEVARGRDIERKLAESEDSGRRLTARVAELEVESLDRKRLAEDREETARERNILRENLERMAGDLQAQKSRADAAAHALQEALAEGRTVRDAMESVLREKEEAVIRSGDLGRELKETLARLEVLECSGRQAAAAEEASRRSETGRREELETEGRQMRARLAEADTRLRELEVELGRERERAGALRVRVDSGEKALQAAQQELAVYGERLRQAETFQERHEQRLEEARASERKLEEALRKASGELETEQAARAQELDRIEQALEKERLALERNEELAAELQTARETPGRWFVAEAESDRSQEWQKMELARLEAQLEQSQRLLLDAERRASRAEEQFAEMLVDWESRKRLAEAFPELNERLEEQKTVLASWEKRGDEWSEREADLRDTIEERQREIEQMRAAIRSLQKTELAVQPVEADVSPRWVRVARAPWALPVGAVLALILGLVLGSWNREDADRALSLADAHGRSSAPLPRENAGQEPGPGGAEKGAARDKTPGSEKAEEPPQAPVSPATPMPALKATSEDIAEQYALKAIKPPKTSAAPEKEEASESSTPEKRALTEPSAGAPVVAKGEGILPSQFLGVKFGSLLSENPALSQWLLDKGIYHRKARLVGEEVEAAVVPDQENRVMKGTYVRICPRSTAELSRFLEWAVSVQDAISAQYGEPSEIREVKEAADAEAIVDRIASGKDRYVAIWSRDGEDASIILSIGAMNERSVVFRLEYFSTALVKAFSERVEADRAKAEEAADSAKPKPEEAPPQALPQASP